MESTPFSTAPIFPAPIFQQRAATLLGIPQSKVSCLMNGKLSMFSLDHLFELLNALDRDVEIIIKPKPKPKTEKFATTQVLMTTTP